MTYERLGYELLDDLCPLCEECHTAIHQIAASGGSLNPYISFSEKRAAEYQIGRTDLVKEKKYVNKMTKQELRQMNKNRLSRPDWREERQLPRK